VDGGVELGRAHRISAFTHTHRHGAHCILGEGSNVGDDHDAHHQTRRQQREARQRGKDELQDGRHDEQGKVAKNDGRDTAEQFENRLGHFAHFGIGELGEVDGDHRPHRNRDQQRDGRRNEGAGNKYHDAKMGIIEERCPLRVGQKIDDADMAEKLYGLGDEHINNAEGGHDRNGGGAEKDGFNELFLPVAHGVVSQTITDLRQARGVICRHSV
jgi:hypothetical protein